MPFAPFEGPKLKIARGRKHVNELDSEITKHLKREPCAILLCRDKTSGQENIDLFGREEIPANFSIIFGDAVHNFRSALDILANDVIALSGVQPKNVYFPFGKDEAGFEEQLNQKMKQAPADIKAIVRDLKPYKGGNDLLRAMHDLDIGDKHTPIMSAAIQMATPALSFNKPTYERIPGERPNRFTFTANLSAFKTTKIDLTGFNIGSDIEVIGRVDGSEISIAIANDLPLAGKPVIRALNDMGDLAESVVKTLESHCLGSHKSAP